MVCIGRTVLRHAVDSWLL